MSESQIPGKQSFWTTLPGILTAVGGVIAGVAALLNALHAIGVVKPPVPTPLPSPTITVSLTTASTLGPTAEDFILKDDFSDEHSGWAVEVTPDSDKVYKDGAFHISVYSANWEAWTYSNRFTDLADLVIEAEAQRVEGSGNNDYGLLTRLTEAGDGFYLFAISTDGHYSVQINQDDEWKFLVPWSTSDAVRVGNVVNHLRVECQGTQLRFIVNGRVLAEVKDATYAAGDVGLAAGTFDQTPISVVFDNVRVWTFK